MGTRPAWCALAVALAAYLLAGLSAWATVVVSFIVFLLTGGCSIATHACKTVPRDISYIVTLVGVVLRVTRSKKKTVADHFAEVKTLRPNKPAILFEDRCWTFQELDEYANKVANFFLELGIQCGDTVALFMTNSPEYVGLLLGLGKIGVRSALVNCNLKEESLLHCITICNPKAIVCSATLTEAIAGIQEKLDESIRSRIFSVGGSPSGLGSSSLDLSQTTSKVPLRPKDLSGKDVFCYIYTSGTTGMPKAVPIRNSKFFQMAIAIYHLARVQPDDVVYMTLPLYHSTGGAIGAGQMLFRGCTIALRARFSASQFWNDCIKHKATVIIHIGELCRYLLAQPLRPQDQQHCIRLAIGNGLKEQIWDQFKNRFNIGRIFEFYGSTEGNASLANTVGKTGACGILPLMHLIRKVYPQVLVKVEPMTGEYVRDSNGFCMHTAINEPGELLGKIADNPASRFDGYVDNVATNKKILTDVFKKGDRYFRTGDIMRLDEMGYFYFCDRTGDTFRWKGENVSTVEVEGIMSRLFNLSDVVVYGVEVPGTEGRAGMAAICNMDDLPPNLYQELSHDLPAYAIPVFIRLISEADTTGTFKLQKVRYRKEGFDVGVVSDPLFMLNPHDKKYSPLDADMYTQLMNKEIRL